MTTETVDVVVIGGGISGLSSAKLLHEAGIDVVVLEARNRVGGRTFTKRDPTYKYVDCGGAYVGPTQNRILRLSNELGVNTYKVYMKGDYLHYSKGKITRFTGTWPKFGNPFAWLDINNAFRKMDQLIQEIPMASPWNAPQAEEWDNKTMKEWIDEICWTQAAKEFVRAFINACVTMEPAEISMLWFMWYIRSCDSSRRIWEVENGGQERKFEGGSQRVSEGMQSILGDRVRLEHPVDRIQDHGSSVTVTCINGNTFNAKYVVLGMAPSLYQKMSFEPPLPPLRNQLIQRVPMGSCIKNEVWYDKAFWRKKGINGFSSAGDGEAPVGNTVDDCKPDGSIPGITGFIMADQARKMANWSPEERCRVTCEFYAKLYGTDEALHPVGYEECNWLAEPYSGGCYTSTYPPGVMTRFGKELRKPLGRLRFAGTETAVVWSGYMDGAVEAGERAAREVLHSMGKIPADQIWQDEPEFKDCPDVPFNVPITERAAPSVGGALKLLAFAGAAVAGAAVFKYSRL